MASAGVGQGGNEIKSQQMVDTANQNSLLNKVLGGVVNAGLGLATGGVSTLIQGATAGMSNGSGNPASQSPGIG
jgi:hypothetical protein